MAQLTLTNLFKKYADTEILKNINLSIISGELIVFVGPSGCGKSTLLRCIAGLEELHQGEITIDGKNVINESPANRGIAMVFQSYALYPHMSVYENIAFNLKLSRTSVQVIQQKVNEVAKILHLEEHLHKLPKQLSGGQRQRVAIGRAIVRNPKVFLFDEPLSNLDAALRTQMRIEIARLHKKLNSTMIYVTHDQTEAMTLSDRIVVLNKGSIEQVGEPMQLYETPQSLFVATFIGNPQMNIFNPNDFYETCEVTKIATQKDAHKIGVRPEHITLSHELNDDNKAKILFEGRVDIIEQFGEYSLVYLNTDFGQTVIVKILHSERLMMYEHSQKTMYLSTDIQYIHLFNKQNQRL